MFVTLTNDFHATTTRTRQGRKSARQMRDLKARLCGTTGCTCSDDIGTRGPQCQPDGSKLLLDWDSDGYAHLSTDPA